MNDKIGPGRRLPPLNALRTFEAAARHLSFTRAAGELHVTQAAVSHQVRTLEDHLGVRLFRRRGRALSLSEAGEALLPGLQDAFDRIEESAKRVHPGHDENVLTVTVQPSFAGAWLISRLPRFAERHPDIDVKLSATHDRVDLTRGDFDVGVRFGPGSWPGDLRVDRLMDEDIFPVCSPALLERGPPLERPEDLRHHTLLHDDHVVDWRMWLLAAGVSGIDTARGPMLNFSDLVLQSAAAGYGVALARSVLAVRYLASGELVRPFEFSLPGRYAYYVVSAAAKANQPKVRKFRDWILEASHEDAVHEAAVVDALRADPAAPSGSGT